MTNRMVDEARRRGRQGLMKIANSEHAIFIIAIKHCCGGCTQLCLTLIAIIKRHVILIDDHLWINCILNFFLFLVILIAVALSDKPVNYHVAYFVREGAHCCIGCESCEK
jgi:hypothetical protein